MPAFLHTDFQDRVDPRLAVDVPQPAPDVVPEPPDEKPDRVPPEINPPETPPEVNEPTVPGEHVPVRDPIVPGEGLSAGAAAGLSPSHLESTHQQCRLRGRSRLQAGLQILRHRCPGRHTRTAGSGSVSGACAWSGRGEGS